VIVDWWKALVGARLPNGRLILATLLVCAGRGMCKAESLAEPQVYGLAAKGGISANGSAHFPA